MTKKIIASLLFFIFAVSVYAVNPDDLLSPDEAFKPTITVVSNDTIKATWDIADEYFMYRKRFKFESDTTGISLGEPIIPRGKVKDDEFFGRVETYRNQVAIEIPVIRDASLTKAIQLSVKTVSQGCADAGVCYPPQRKTLSVGLKALKVATTEEPKIINVVKEEKQASVGLMDELGLSGLVNQNAPIPPEEAFQVNLNTEQGQLLKANWNITKGHYLFQDKIKLRIVEPVRGLTISDIDLPPAIKENDPLFGVINTYNENFSVSAKIDGNADLLSKDIMVKATYQGCSKLTGICYPPQHDTLKVNFSENQFIKVAAKSSIVDSAPQMDLAPAMDNLPADQQQASVMSEFTGTANGITSSPVSSSPLIEKSDLASQLGLSDLSTDMDVLDPNEAFVFDLSVTDKQTLNARWDIVKGHYLYQHMFKFKVLDENSGVTLGEVELPPGKEEFDQYFGDVVIYYDSFDAKVPVSYNGNNKVNSIKVRTTYQGCSKLTGICYPPQHKTQTVNLAAAPDAGSDNNTELAVKENKPSSGNDASADSNNNTSAVNAANNKVSEQDGLMNKLLNGGFFNSLLIFFIAGLALTFTPCVFPMIPILSGIIAGQGSDNSTKKSFFLSLSYVLAMAVTYAVVGVIAALSGENLQVALQNPWVIGSFAILFVLLSLSMFGFYELQMPASIQSKLTNISNSQNGGSMANAGVMGFLSALIVGPCVTAPLIAALVYIAQTKDVVLGGMSLFALGLGMGTPLLIIGTSAGKILPRAGAWMDSVKAGFGILMLAMAIWMLDRILPFEIIAVLTGILVIFSAIYMGALDPLTEASTGWKRFFKASGLVLIIYGVTLLLGAASGNASLFKPLKGFTGGGIAQISAEPQHLVFKRIKSVNDLENALASAKQQNQSVMLDFYADWCISCKEMEHNTFTDKSVIESMKDTLLIQADVTLDDEQDKALNKRFGLYGPPAIIFFDKEGNENKPYRIVGYKGPKDFHEHVEQFKQTLN